MPTLDPRDSDPEYVFRLRARLKLLKEAIEQGNVRFAKDAANSAIKGLNSVRYGPDGEIDLSTVDSSVRALALAVEAMEDRRKTKNSTSLIDVQNEYFRIFGE